MTEEKKINKPEVTFTVQDALGGLDIPTLTSGDSGKLDFKLFCYLKIRQKIVERALDACSPLDERVAQLGKELEYLLKVQATLYDEDNELYGHCYRVAHVLSMSQQISVLPQDEKNATKVVYTADKVRFYINLILKWDGSEAQLAQKVPSQTSSTGDLLADEKDAVYPKTLEDVLECMSSYIFQENPRFLELFIPEMPKLDDFNLEIIDREGRIFVSDVSATLPITRTACFCKNERELSRVLARFSMRLFPEDHPVLLRLMPFSQEINLIGHAIVICKNKDRVRIQDQTTDAQFHESEHQKIAECIFSTRRALYIEKQKAEGFLLSFQICEPLKLINQSSSSIPIPGAMKTVITYPSVSDILNMQSSITPQQRGCFLLWAMHTDQFSVANDLLGRKEEIDVDVMSDQSDFCLFLAIYHKQPHITRQLLIRDAHLYFQKAEKFDVLDLLLAETLDHHTFIRHVHPRNFPDYPEKIGNALLADLLKKMLSYAEIDFLPDNSFGKIAWLTTKLAAYPDNAYMVVAIFYQELTEVPRQYPLYIAEKISAGEFVDTTGEIECLLREACKVAAEPDFDIEPNKSSEEDDDFLGFAEDKKSSTTKPKNKRKTMSSDSSEKTIKKKDKKSKKEVSGSVAQATSGFFYWEGDTSGSQTWRSIPSNLTVASTIQPTSDTDDEPVATVLSPRPFTPPGDSMS